MTGVLTNEMTGRLTEWASARPDVRAMILTSTRAIPDAIVDAYSDYDVVIVVDDVATMYRDRSWLTDFGEVLVSYWDPVHHDDASGAVWVGSVNNYRNGLKIDFSVWSRQRYADVTAGPDPHPEFDAGHQVLVDKDRLTSTLPAATYRSYIPRPPDEATYQTLITDFLIGVPYVAKSLLRDELLPAKWVLDFDMRFNYLVPMLEWRVECDHDWSLKTGSLGKGLRKQLPADAWDQLVGTFTGVDPESNWHALFQMIDLFGRTAEDVAEAQGFTYPHDLITDVAQHARDMRLGHYAHGPRSES